MSLRRKEQPARQGAGLRNMIMTQGKSRPVEEPLGYKAEMVAAQQEAASPQPVAPQPAVSNHHGMSMNMEDMVAEMHSMNERMSKMETMVRENSHRIKTYMGGY